VTIAKRAALGGLSLVVAFSAYYVWAYVAPPLREQLEANRTCCQLPFARNLVVSARELLGWATYPSQVGQDKWVLEKMFPGVTNGFFLDVGSGHGTFHSNTVALERRGWTGVCVDPFPTDMETRTCRVFKEVVWSTPGTVMTFHMAEGLAGLADTLDRWREEAVKAPAVEVTTVTLDDLLTRAQAPPFIHFLSLDIEGAELEALKAFPFDRVRLGSLAIEHNYEEPKRSQLVALLARHGYELVHSVYQDDFFAPVAAR
jgi:FkbM family methyltransferase